MAPGAFSGPRLAPPISDTADTTATPATSPGSTCSVFRSSNRPGTCSGRRVRRRSRPTTTPAATATATHHQCPPNQPGWESSYHLPPNLITPMNTSPANAPNTPSTTAYPIKTQNSRFWVTGGAAAAPGRDAHHADLAGAELPAVYSCISALGPDVRICRDEGCPGLPKHLSVTQPSCAGARKIAPPNGTA